MSEERLFSIVSADEGDISFVKNSWMKSYRRYADKGVGYDLYIREYPRYIDRVIEKAEVDVAVNRSDVDQILGYMVYDTAERDIAIHYAYVKSGFRRLGVAAAILERIYDVYGKTQTWATHMTPIAESALEGKTGIRFNPYRR